MKYMLQMINPTRQNATQRKGFFGALAISALVLFLHFPIEGYEVGYYAIEYQGVLMPCSAFADSQRFLPTAEEVTCYKYGSYQFHSFSEWKSKGPIVVWFGSVVHTLAALAFVVAVGALWLWVFRNDSDG